MFIAALANRSITVGALRTAAVRGRSAGHQGCRRPVAEHPGNWVNRYLSDESAIAAYQQPEEGTAHMSNEENVSTVASDGIDAHRRAGESVLAEATGASATGAAATGASRGSPLLALAVGRSRWGWWPGRLVIRRAVIRELRVGELETGHLRWGAWR